MPAKRPRNSKGGCSCGSLEEEADDPDSPVEFDRRLHEYHIHGSQRRYVILRYCPSCGGAAPPSKRQQLFAHIDDAETSRLRRLTKPLKTLRQVLKTLGRPDRDLDAGMTVRTP